MQQQNPWENDAVVPAGGMVITKAAGPKYQYEGPQAAADLTSAQARAREAAAKVPFAPRVAAAETTKAEADATKAQLEAQTAQTAAANKPDPEAARIQTQLQTDDVLTQIGRARDLINNGWATGMTGTVLGKLPGTDATDLDSSLSTIKSNVTQSALSALKQQSAQGASGFGALSDSEGRLLANSIASLDQRQSPQQLLDNLAAVERHYRRGLAFLNKEDPRDPNVAAKYDIATMPPMAGGPGALGGGDNQGGGLSLSTNGYETTADPTLIGVNAHVRGMIGAGRPAGDIVSYINSVAPGVGDQRAGDVAAAVKFRSQNPTVPLDRYPVSLENKTVPLSPVHSFVNTSAQSPFGAAVMNGADAITGGYLDNLTTNPAAARAGMAAVSAANPGSAFTGQILGAGLTGLAGEAAAAKMGLSSLGAMRAADAGYGALYGSGNADDGNRLTGALEGAAAGSVGGMFGRGLSRVGGRAVAGIQDAGKRALIDSGIPLTLGQATNGTGKGLEDRLAGFPLIGDLINARRKEGSTAFQQTAFKEALSSIGGNTNGAIAENGVARGLGQVSDAYDQALGGKAVTIDPQYKATTGALAQRIGAIPRVGPELAAALDTTVSPMFQSGVLSGHDMQAIDRGLQQVKSGYATDPLFHTHIAPAVDAVGDNVRGLFERQAQEVLPGYDAAKGAYRNMSVLADAVNAGINTGGEFTAAQLGQQARKNAVKFGSRNAAASGDRPFSLLQRAAQEVLPSKIPDSGTAGRVAIPALAGAVGGLGGYSTSPDEAKTSNATLGALALGGLAALPYTRASQALLSRAVLAERPAAAIAIGNAVNKNPRWLGMFGRGAALDRYLLPSQ